MATQLAYVVSDSSGNYTISPVHSDLCLEVSTEKIADRTAVLERSHKEQQRYSMQLTELVSRLRFSQQELEAATKAKSEFAKPAAVGDKVHVPVEDHRFREKAQVDRSTRKLPRFVKHDLLEHRSDIIELGTLCPKLASAISVV